MNRLEYAEKVLKELLWIYDEKHRFYLDNGYRFEGRTESQWMALVLEHAKKVLGLPGGIKTTEFPVESQHTVKVRFLDPVTKQTVELPFEHYMVGDVYPLNGIRLLELNIPQDVLSVIEKKGGLEIQTLNGEKAVNLIPKFQEIIKRLEFCRDIDPYLRTVHYLLTMAQLRPDSIFELSKPVTQE